jgi:hypothetical protein
MQDQPYAPWRAVLTMASIAADLLAEIARDEDLALTTADMLAEALERSPDDADEKVRRLGALHTRLVAIRGEAA